MGFFYLKQGETTIQSGETQISEFSVDLPSNFTDAPIEYTVEFIDDDNVSGSTTVTVPNCGCEVSAVTEETSDSTTSATNIIISSITPSHASEVTLDYRGGDVPFYLGYDYVTSWQKRSVSSDTCGNIAYGEWEDKSTTGHSAISFDFGCHECFTIQTFSISSEAATTFTKVATITRKTDLSECSTVELPTSCTRAGVTWINECSAKTTTNGVEIYAKYTANTTSTTRYGTIKLTDCNDLEINLVQNAAVISTNDYYLQVNAYLNGCEDSLNYNTIEVNVIRKSDSAKVYTYDEQDIDHTVSIDPPISANNTNSNRTYTITVDGTDYSADTYVGTVTQYTCASNDTLSLDITSAAESTGGQDAFQTTYFVRFNSVSLASGKQLTNPYIKINLREGIYDCSGNETNTSTSSHILGLGEATPSTMSDYDGGRDCKWGGQFYDVHNWTGLFFSYETRPDGIQISAKDNLSAIQI